MNKQDNNISTNNVTIQNITSGRDTNIVIGNLKKEIPKHLNVVPNFDFKLLVDRIDIIKHLHDFLTNNTSVVLMNGVGGIGKTTLALAYVNNPKYSDTYKHIAWITVKGKIKANLFEVFSKANLGFIEDTELSEDENFENLIETLRLIEGTLLVIDNANDPFEIANIKSELEALRWKVLFTSRSKPAVDNVLIINELEREYAKDLFYQHFYREKNDEILFRLLEKIEYHTLLIILLAKAAEKNIRLNIVKLYDLMSKNINLKEPRLQGKISIETSVNKHEFEKELKLYDCIIAVFEVNEFILNDTEKQYLRYFSILPYIEISLFDLFLFFQISEEQEIDFRDILEDLVKKGWLIGDYKNGTYKMHQLVQTSIRETLKPDTKNCSSLINYFISATNMNFGDNGYDLLKYTVYATSISENIKEETKELGQILYNTSFIYSFTGRIKLAEGLAFKATTIFENLPTEKDFLVKVYRNIGMIYNSIPLKVDLGLEYNLKALKIAEEIYSNTDFELGRIYRGLGNTYRIIADFEKSVQFHEKAIEIFKQLYDYQLDLAECYDHYGFTLSKLKKFQKSLEFRLLAYELRNRLLSSNHPKVIASLNNVGTAYGNVKDNENALIYKFKALEIMEKFPTKNWNSIASYYNNISVSYRKMQKYDLAVDYCKKSIEIAEMQNVDYHSKRYGSSFFNLASIYFEMNDLENAKIFINKSLEIRKLILKEKDTIYKNTINLYNKIFGILENTDNMIIEST